MHVRDCESEWLGVGKGRKEERKRGEFENSETEEGRKACGTEWYQARGTLMEMRD